MDAGARRPFVASPLERWRSALDGYTSAVTPSNQRAVAETALCWAKYLNAMHDRIHPIFADSFLAALDSLPPSHPMNDQHLVTRLEIVLKRDGHIKQIGVVKTSGITAFDAAALDSVDWAQPFAPAPSAIASADGNVYLRWEFHREERYACSTMGARPYRLR